MWLKFGVALSGLLTSIDEVVRGKTNLACLYCGGSLTAKKGSVKEHHASAQARKLVNQSRSGLKPKLSHRCLSTTASTSNLKVRNWNS